MVQSSSFGNPIAFTISSRRWNFNESNCKCWAIRPASSCTSPNGIGIWFQYLFRQIGYLPNPGSPTGKASQRNRTEEKIQERWINRGGQAIRICTSFYPAFLQFHHVIASGFPARPNHLESGIPCKCLVRQQFHLGHQIPHRLILWHKTYGAMSVLHERTLVRQATAFSNNGVTDSRIGYSRHVIHLHHPVRQWHSTTLTGIFTLILVIRRSNRNVYPQEKRQICFLHPGVVCSPIRVIWSSLHGWISRTIVYWDSWTKNSRWPPRIHARFSQDNRRTTIFIPSCVNPVSRRDQKGARPLTLLYTFSIPP